MVAEFRRDGIALLTSLALVLLVMALVLILVSGCHSSKKIGPHPPPPPPPPPPDIYVVPLSPSTVKVDLEVRGIQVPDEFFDGKKAFWLLTFLPVEVDDIASILADFDREGPLDFENVDLSSAFDVSHVGLPSLIIYRQYEESPPPLPEGFKPWVILEDNEGKRYTDLQDPPPGWPY